MSSESEQILHDLELRYSSLHKEYDSISVERDALKENVSSLQTLYHDILTKNQSLLSDKQELELKIHQHETTIRDIETIKQDLSNKFHEKSNENEKLKNQLKLNSEELSQLKLRLKDLQINISDSQSQILPLQYDITRLQQEKKFLEERFKVIDEDLQIKNKMLSDEKLANTNMKFDYENKISCLQSELDSNKSLLKSNSERLDTQNETVQSYTAKIQQLEDLYSAFQERSNKEIDNLKRVIDLHKRHFDESISTISELEDTITKIKSNHIQVIDAQKTEFHKHIEKLQESWDSEKNEYLIRIRDVESSSVQNVLVDNTTVALSSKATNLIENHMEIDQLTHGSSLTVTELYDRIVKLDKDLIDERSKKQEVELYLNRVLRDVEQKAPIIASQKREYTKIVESYEHVTRRMDDLIQSNSQLNEKFVVNEKLLKQSQEHCSALEQHNKDLSSQVQNLIKRTMELSMGSGSSSTAVSSTGDTIGDYLVTFNNVEELQTRNSQLLRTIRKLESELHEQDQLKKDLDTSNDELQHALKELSNLKDARQRTEDMVQSLIQQRDMFKTMLDEQQIFSSKTGMQISSSPIVNNNRELLTPGSALRSPNSPSIPATVTRRLSGSLPNMQQVLDDMQAKMKEVEKEKAKLQERLIRLEESESILNSNLASSSTELSKLRIENAKYFTESAFFTNRISQLEENIKIVETEKNTLLSKRIDAEHSFNNQLKESRLKDETIRQLNDQIHVLKNQVKQVEVEVEVLKSNEKRLLEQCDILKADIKKQVNLSESVNRIELSLSNRIEREKDFLVQEKESLVKVNDELKTSFQGKTHELEQLRLQHQHEISELKIQYEAVSNQLQQCKATMSSNDLLLKTSQERCNLLEKQLVAMQERMGPGSASNSSASNLFVSSMLESMNTTELKEKSIEIENLQLKVNTLQLELETSKEHVEQYRRISLANETTLQELQRRIEASSEAYESSIRELMESKRLVENQLEEIRLTSHDSVQEMEDLKDTIHNLNKQLESREEVLEEQKSIFQNEKTQLSQQLEILKKDILKFQSIAKESHKNYEHELQLHAKAERDLLELSSEVDDMKSSLIEAKQAQTNVMNDMIRKDLLFAEEKKTYETKVSELNVKMEELQKVNDILHNQLQALSQKVSPNVDSIADVEESLPTTAIEVQDLRKANVEMRDVIRYMKREHELLEGKFSISEQEVERHQVMLSAAYRQLDEVRGLLKQSADANSTNIQIATLTAEVNQLKVDIRQIPILQESNMHLRSENEDLMQKLLTSEQKLQDLTLIMQPNEEKLLKLTNEKAAIQKVNKTLENDVKYWRERLHLLVSRYNEVDPEEFKQLKAQHDALLESSRADKEELMKLEAVVSEKSSELEKLTEVHQKATEENNQSIDELTKKTQELANLQGVYDKLDKNCENLRNSLRNLKSLKEKVEAESQSKISKLEKALEEANKAATTITPSVVLVSEKSNPVDELNTSAASSTRSKSMVLPFSESVASNQSNANANADANAESLPPTVIEVTEAPIVRKKSISSTNTTVMVPISIRETTITETNTNEANEVAEVNAPNTFVSASESMEVDPQKNTDISPVSNIDVHDTQKLSSDITLSKEQAMKEKLLSLKRKAQVASPQLIKSDESVLPKESNPDTSEEDQQPKKKTKTNIFPVVEVDATTSLTVDDKKVSSNMEAFEPRDNAVEEIIMEDTPSQIEESMVVDEVDVEEGEEGEEPEECADTDEIAEAVADDVPNPNPNPVSNETLTLTNPFVLSSSSIFNPSSTPVFKSSFGTSGGIFSAKNPFLNVKPSDTQQQTGGIFGQSSSLFLTSTGNKEEEEVQGKDDDKGAISVNTEGIHEVKFSVPSPLTGKIPLFGSSAKLSLPIPSSTPVVESSGTSIFARKTPSPTTAVLDAVDKMLANEDNEAEVEVVAEAPTLEAQKVTPAIVVAPTQAPVIASTPKSNLVSLKAAATPQELQAAAALKRKERFDAANATSKTISLAGISASKSNMKTTTPVVSNANSSTSADKPVVKKLVKKMVKKVNTGKPKVTENKESDK